MNPEFWNDRYQATGYAYGQAPNDFIAKQAGAYLPEGGSVLDLGGGEGRNAVFLAEAGYDVTLLDYARAGLEKAKQLAAERDVSIRTIQADATAWSPSDTWDGLITTFLHMPSAHRAHLYRIMREAVRPTGTLLAEWFRPEQIRNDYGTGGPPSDDLMVTKGELLDHFPKSGIRHLAACDTTLDEGSYHQGRAAVVRLIWSKPATG